MHEDPAQLRGARRAPSGTARGSRRPRRSRSRPRRGRRGTGSPRATRSCRSRPAWPAGTGRPGRASGTRAGCASSAASASPGADAGARRPAQPGHAAVDVVGRSTRASARSSECRGDVAVLRRDRRTRRRSRRCGVDRSTNDRGDVSRAGDGAIVLLGRQVVARPQSCTPAGLGPRPVQPADRGTGELQTAVMTTAVIVDAIRTPLGRRNGKLKDWHPVDLAAETLKALVERTGHRPGHRRRRGHGLRDAGRRAGASTSPATPCSPPAGPKTCPARRSTASAAPASRRPTSPPRA